MVVGGREWVPVSFSGRGYFQMCNASSESLGCKFLSWSRTVTPFQSTPWPAFHASSNIVDALKFGILTAVLCPPSSCTASSWFLPHRWPGILHKGYSKSYPISPCQGLHPCSHEGRSTQNTRGSCWFCPVTYHWHSLPSQVPFFKPLYRECRPIKLLQDNDGIMILPRDKGRAIVMMDR